MARRSETYEFNITVMLPAEENRAEYDLRVGRAVAETLMEILPPKSIDELIQKYREMKDDRATKNPSPY